jgi:hypothetical protein
MLFGESTFAEVAFSSSPRDANVIVSVIKNQLNITIGSVGIIASAIIEDPDPNQVTLGLGILTITGDANFTVTGSQVALGIGNFVVTAAANVNVTGNTLTLATGNVIVTGTCVSKSRWIRSIFRYSRTGNYYMERYNTRSNNGLDTNSTLLNYGINLFNRPIIRTYHNRRKSRFVGNNY